MDPGFESSGQLDLGNLSSKNVHGDFRKPDPSPADHVKDPTDGYALKVVRRHSDLHNSLRVQRSIPGEGFENNLSSGNDGIAKPARVIKDREIGGVMEPAAFFPE